MAEQRAPAMAFVALGANLENPAGQIRQALQELDRIADTRVAAHSSFYRTAPVGILDQPDFVNAVARLETGLAPRAVLEALFAIENLHGRRRGQANAPRTLDLDLLLYGSLTIDEPGLQVPHPRMQERGFVLVPLAEIAAEVLVPGLGRVADLLARVDRSGVELLDAA
jgi:2-amino-4-hydroxy-6-hydroxymethyldihydropteridine diphosphokinase